MIRPWHDAAHPAHVTLRVRPGLPSLRAARVFPAVRAAIRLAQRETFGICHFSVQSNHIHLLVEARHREALVRGVQGLAIRLARAVNRAVRRSGKVWADRYHRRDLATPREVRHALVYVLQNFRKHAAEARGLDSCSSAAWFTGWRDCRPASPAGVLCPVIAAGTWLLSTGWRRHGLIDVREKPGRARLPAP